MDKGELIEALKYIDPNEAKKSLTKWWNTSTNI